MFTSKEISISVMNQHSLKRNDFENTGKLIKKFEKIIGTISVESSVSRCGHGPTARQGGCSSTGVATALDWTELNCREKAFNTQLHGTENWITLDTELHGILKCLTYWSALHTEVHWILKCIAYWSWLHTEVHYVLQCTTYCIAPYTAAPGI